MLFWAFRYYPSYFGVPLVADRAVLVPTAEDDRAIDLEVLEQFFQQPAGYIFLTPEEERLVVDPRRTVRSQPFTIIGSGLEPAQTRRCRGGRCDRHRLPPATSSISGRVDRNKGCDTLLEYFQTVRRGRRRAALLSWPDRRRCGFRRIRRFARSATCRTSCARHCSRARAR